MVIAESLNSSKKMIAKDGINMGAHPHTNSKAPIYIKIYIFGVIFHAHPPNSKHGFTTKSFEKKDAFEKPETAIWS